MATLDPKDALADNYRLFDQNQLNSHVVRAYTPDTYGGESNSNNTSNQNETKEHNNNNNNSNSNDNHNNDTKKDDQNNNEDEKEEENAIQKYRKQNEEEKKEKLNLDLMSNQDKLYHYARNGDIEGLKFIVKQPQIDINGHCNSDDFATNNTALHYVVETGNLECVELLFNVEADIEVTNKLQSTPLHIACAFGYYEIVSFLVGKKANVHSMNMIRNKPLHCAIYGGYIKIVELLLEQYSDPIKGLSEKNFAGKCGIDYAKHDEIREYLRSHYFPNEKKKIGFDDNENENNDDDNNNNNNNDDDNDNENDNDIKEEEKNDE